MTDYIILNDDRSERVRYDYSNYPIYLRKGLLSFFNNYKAVSHWHDDIEFIYVLSGEMEYNINGQVILIKENCGLLVNSKQLHYGFSTEQKECEFLCVLLHPMMLCFSHSAENDFVLPVISNESLPFILLEPDVDWQNEILICINQMFENMDDEAFVMRVQSLFAKIWSLVFDHMPKSENKQPNSSNLTALKNMVGFIQKHYSEQISLAQIAASGNVSQSKCCMLFSNFLKKTPINYLAEFRLSKGAELLKISDMTVTEIAYATGFNSSSYFAECFKSHIGMTPNSFRKISKSVG